MSAATASGTASLPAKEQSDREAGAVCAGRRQLRIDRLVLTNESDVPKSFTIFSYLEFCLWNAVDDSTNFQRNFSTGEVEVEGSTIYHKTEIPRAPQPLRIVHRQHAH